jgi:hypothetical protein
VNCGTNLSQGQAFWIATKQWMSARTNAISLFGLVL